MQLVDSEQSAVITLRVILLSIFLAVILAASSTYLALKVGILPAASIPAAILAMAILRLLTAEIFLKPILSRLPHQQAKPLPEVSYLPCRR